MGGKIHLDKTKKQHHDLFDHRIVTQRIASYHLFCLFRFIQLKSPLDYINQGFATDILIKIDH